MKINTISHSKDARWVKGYEGLYKVTKAGRVYSWSRKTPIELKPALRINGYIFVTLYREKIRSMVNIHRLVASTFIPNPENKATVNHKNGKKNDNRVENLEWATHSENIVHSRSVLGFVPTGSKGESNRLSKPIIADNGTQKIRFACLSEASRYVGSRRSTINNAVRGRLKTLKGYKWYYA